MVMWRLVALSAFCAAIAGCEEPARIVPTAAPGTEAPPPVPPSEKDPAQALGEAVRADASKAAAKPAPAAEIPLATPTAKGETKTTASGVKYETVKPGDGPEAKAGSFVKVHYVGTLDNGEQFDSSRKRNEPFSFQVGTRAVIKGWDEAIPGMKVGEVRKLKIPADAAYGERGQGSIPPNSPLNFEVELVEVK